MRRTTTLLDLLMAVSQFARTDAEIVATVVYLVNTGKVSLGGNFRGARFGCEGRRMVREVAA